jgi:hypothetical protein
VGSSSGCLGRPPGMALVNLGQNRAPTITLVFVRHVCLRFIVRYVSPAHLYPPSVYGRASYLIAESVLAMFRLLRSGRALVCLAFQPSPSVIFCQVLFDHHVQISTSCRLSEAIPSEHSVAFVNKVCQCACLHLEHHSPPAEDYAHGQCAAHAAISNHEPGWQDPQHRRVPQRRPSTTPPRVSFSHTAR